MVVQFRKTCYEPVQRITAEPGSRERITFKMQLDVNGRRKLVENGKVDVYEQIQSHKDSVDINYLLTRYANGDTAALSKVQGLYGDFTTIPTSVVELKNRVMDAERLFYQLPLETREKFEHNPSMFYSMIGSDAFNEIFSVDKAKENPVMETPAPVPSTPVVTVKEVTNV